MWGFSARREKFGLSANLETLHSEDLKTAVLALMKGWDSALRRMVQDTEAADLSAFSVKTSVPIPSWETRNVTLLGDALHNMTPFREIGANAALRDAAALRQALVGVARGERPLLSALAAYEREMIEYGFRAVRMSLENMQRVHSEGISREFTKFIFRMMNLVPPLKERFHSNR
jgi:2-polyprenyl-6-methoxyphenol hydroxylase-like FAD-dependent oxidoreductase